MHSFNKDDDSIKTNKQKAKTKQNKQANKQKQRNRYLLFDKLVIDIIQNKPDISFQIKSYMACSIV